MRPPAEQVVRDYLNRLTVAARILPPEDRQAFLARYQNIVERQSGVRDMADPADVMRALSGIGEPEALVERERTRLDAQRKEREAAASKVSFWKPSPRGGAPGRNGTDGGPASPYAHLTRKDGRPVGGEIKKPTTRPISSRWRPGEPLKPKKGRRGRVPPPPPDRSRRPDRDGAADSGPPAEPQAAGSQAGGPRPDDAPSGAVSSALAAAGGAAAATGAAGAAATETPAPPAPAGTPVTPAPAGTAPAPAAPAPAGEPANPAPTRRLRPQLPRRLQPGDITRDMARMAAEAGRQHRRETVAVVMLALGGLIIPFPLWEVGFLLWLAGAFIAATSKWWSLPDKWLGLVGPPALVIIGTAVAVSLGGARSTGSAYLHETLTTSMYLFMLGAVLGAGYLAWRIHRGRRPASIPPWLWRRHT